MSLHLTQSPSKKLHVGPRSSPAKVWMHALQNSCRMAFDSLCIIWDAVFWRAAVEIMIMPLHLAQTPSEKMHVGPRTSSPKVQAALAARWQWALCVARCVASCCIFVLHSPLAVGGLCVWLGTVWLQCAPVLSLLAVAVVVIVVVASHRHHLAL